MWENINKSVQWIFLDLDKESKEKLEILISEIVKEFNFEIHSIDLFTHKNPIIFKITIKKPI